MSVPSVGVPAFAPFQDTFKRLETGEDPMDVDFFIDPSGNTISETVIKKSIKLIDKNGQPVPCEQGEEGQYIYCPISQENMTIISEMYTDRPLPQRKVISLTALHPNPIVKELVQGARRFEEKVKRSSDPKNYSSEMFPTESTSSSLIWPFSFDYMENPVVDKHGHTFDLVASKENNNASLVKCPHCPPNGELIPIDKLYPNRIMIEVTSKIKALTKKIETINHLPMSQKDRNRVLSADYILLAEENACSEERSQRTMISNVDLASSLKKQQKMLEDSQQLLFRNQERIEELLKQARVDKVKNEEVIKSKNDIIKEHETTLQKKQQELDNSQKTLKEKNIGSFVTGAITGSGLTISALAITYMFKKINE